MAPATAFGKEQVIVLFGIVLGVCGIALVGVAKLRKISRTGEWTKWSLAHQVGRYSERRLWLVGSALVLAGMALMWAGNRLRW